MRAPLKSWLFGVAVVLAPLTAAAEEPTKPYPECDHQPSDGEVAGAKGAFQAGQASFEEGDYNRAISYWEDAYRRDCTAHALLLNLARAYELNNQKRHAVTALETYLARNPSAPQRDLIARRIDGLNEKIAQDEAAAKTTGPATSGPAPKPGEKPPTKSGGKRPITPLIVAGAGGAITIVGGVLYFIAASDVKKAEDACPNRKCSDQSIIDQGNSARSRQTLWGVVSIVGLATAAGGAAWYFLSPPEGQSTTAKRRTFKPRVDPVVGRGFTGISLSGAF